jgi:hypothetical protein
MVPAACAAPGAPVVALNHRVSRGVRLRQSRAPRRSSRWDVASTTRASASDGSARRDATTSVALKEWAAVVAALASGEQTVLFRKGGLRDGGGKTKGFTLESGRFALFPTNYHPPNASAADVLARPEASRRAPDMRRGESVPLRVAGEVTGAWTTRDPGVLDALGAHHVWSGETLASRLRWKPEAPITVIEVRAYRADDGRRQTTLPPDVERFGGCASWVHLPEPVALGTPALSDAEFAARAEALRSALEAVEHEPLEWDEPGEARAGAGAT